MTPTEQPQDVQQGGFPMNTNSSGFDRSAIPLLEILGLAAAPEGSGGCRCAPEDSRSALTANDGAYCVGDSRQK